eukprot:TRINITY_DN13084_c0_g1::TRINITY_DN13084_c0_g1_i1::g.10659::m.10659 TRINITY_DN13084_c0_g1::TRINITY_DN13084_c0_g1_i1::g.10659  ORF type:complete len:498 (-),score=89.96,sp/Q502K3/ANR52_DANRE/32.05/4e-20,sp/Q502K3/ANR52_DANRE/30.21/4e-13,sp/Q502K3/ANR52_DANRE/28.57/1e-12,sp/Q502K3/ANR52_DANRE/25.07/1e-10,sp/Q502K3/ANR52_DANRE/30.43/2e-10,sp/Q502K3/ANR52_DANRE/28.36/2e-10,sp/Q502K3/ANR52_DANRE/35.81/7e-10,sp/Q502K3/ANR52_DANRE/31.29/6e-09,sp/Q502K3/ANR52_DANRE/31.21/7e-07,sp/Q502K3/ANR52_DANRE/28.71/
MADEDLISPENKEMLELLELPEGIRTDAHEAVIQGDFTRLGEILKDTSKIKQYLYGIDDRGLTALHYAASCTIDSVFLTLRLIAHDAATIMDPVQDLMPELRINLLKDFCPVFGLQYPNDRVDLQSSRWKLVNESRIQITLELSGAGPTTPNNEVGKCRTSIEMAKLVMDQLKDRDSHLMSASYTSDLDPSYIPSYTHRYGAWCLERLIRAGADVNKPEPVGVVPLHKAAANGLESGVRLMLEYRADPTVKDMYGDTPLHRAAWNGQTACAEALLQNLPPGYTNSQNNQKMTPLHFAAMKGHVEIIRLLLAYGADSTARSVIGWCAIHYAAAQGHIRCVAALIENFKKRELNFKELEALGSGDNVMHVGLQAAKMELVLWLCKNFSVCVSKANSAGEVPLDMANRLIKAGDDGAKGKKGKKGKPKGGKKKKAAKESTGNTHEAMVKAAGVYPILTPQRIEVLKQLTGPISKAG